MVGIKPANAATLCNVLEVNQHRAGGDNAGGIFMASGTNSFEIRNHSNCTFPITVFSSKMFTTYFPGTNAAQQTFYFKHYMVQPFTNQTFVVNIPSDCGYQIDMWYGNYEPGTIYGLPADGIDWQLNNLLGVQHGSACAMATPTPTPTPSPTATPTPTPTPVAQIISCQDGATLTQANGNVVICNSNVNQNTNNNSATGGNASVSIGNVTVKAVSHPVKATPAKKIVKPIVLAAVTYAPVPVHVTAKTGAESALPAIFSVIAGVTGLGFSIRKGLK